MFSKLEAKLVQGDYLYQDATPSHTHEYLWKNVVDALRQTDAHRVIDVGCGNGALARYLALQGFDVVGVDPSESGIEAGRAASAELDLHIGSAYDDLTSRFGTFNAVISLEVVEHVFYPRRFAKTLFDLLKPGGTAVVSTPYHGYWKNLALAVSGRLDNHFTALWDYGHIKFWSVRTLGQLLREAGFVQVDFRRVGRFAPLAKSMIAVACKPSTATTRDSLHHGGPTHSVSDYGDAA